MVGGPSALVEKGQVKLWYFASGRRDTYEFHIGLATARIGEQRNVAVPPVASVTPLSALPGTSSVTSPFPGNESDTCRNIMTGSQLADGFDMPVLTSHERSGWLRQERDHFVAAYPAGQSWGGVFVTVGPLRPLPRPDSIDLASCRTLAIDMMWEAGNREIEVLIKDNTQPDDGTETKVRVTLTPEWRTYTFPLSRFRGADLKRLYIVTAFSFLGKDAQTIRFRNIKYLSRPAP